jgi:RNA polymerase sigma-70 factor (ECF subfamily)
LWHSERDDEMPEERDLITAARSGDAQALEELLARHQSQIYRFGMKMCGDPEDAKDVLQDTLLAMARGVRDFRGESSLATWLYAVARSFCIKKRRRSKFAPRNWQSLETDAGVEVKRLTDPSGNPAEALEGKRLEKALEDAVSVLDPKYREVLVLRDMEGLTAREVAEVLGIGVDAVKSRLHRARLAVRAALSPLLGVPAGEAAARASCPDVLTLLSRHLEDELSPEVCSEMERHLQSCERCRGACESLRRTLRLCQTAPAVSVPEGVQKSVRAALRAFLDERR